MKVPVWRSRKLPPNPLREKGTMLRKIVVILAVLLSSMATQLYALGLGTVTVESALNQPLRMRIEILQLGDTRLQDVRISMASNDDFARFNIERASFLSNVRFSIESTAQGNVVILTSSQIVREPYLSFILDTRWPNGRLLSEHTVLLDLPVFNNQQPTPEVRQPISPVLQPPADSQTGDAEPFVEQAATPAVTPSSASPGANLQPEVIEPEPADEPVQSEEAEQPELTAEETEPVAAEEVVVVEEPEVEEEAEPIAAASEPVQPEAVEPAPPETIETDSSDTLSDIALQVRPDSSVSMQQTMLAIQELNPDAFADGNINRLRSGQVLRVPTLEDIQAIDPRDAVDEVSRQNQAFTDLQPLAPPADADADQDDQPQGQLSVVASDDAIDASSGAAELGGAENAELDQRIAELETQLAQRQEEADRARIEREELDSRMADLEEQIAAAQEIIRLQDIQLAQLQDSLAAAAAEAQAAAEQQAILAAAEAEAAQPVESPGSLVDDVLRLVTGNIIFMISGVVLIVLLLVVLMLRRNRAAKMDDEDDDIDEIAEQDFIADEQDAGDDENDEAATEFQDYDASELDSELDDIIGVSDEVEIDSGASEDSASTDEDEDSLDVLSIVEPLIEEKQYRRALSMLNTSLQAQGESDAVRAKIEEVEALLEAEDAEERQEQAETQARDAEQRKTETKSFLDDLGIDLDSFDYDEEESPEASPEPKASEAEKPAEEDSPDSEDVDLMFDLGGDDAAADEESTEEQDEGGDLGEIASDTSDEADAFEFDLDDDSKQVESEAKDADDIEVDTFEFDAGAADEIKADSSADDDEDIDLETFSFDADAAASVKAESEKQEKESEESQEEDPNAVDFAFDKSDIDDASEAPEPASNEEVETFDFDLETETSDTVLEKPDADAGAGEDFDFDLDEFEVEATTTENEKTADADDDFLDLDAEAEKAGGDVTEILGDASDEIEFDVDEEPAPGDDKDDKKDASEELDDDLDFLADDDVEIESVEDVDDDVDMLSDADETATKLELAYAYQKMGDKDGAKEILQEVIKEGSDEQITEAKKLLDTLEG